MQATFCPYCLKLVTTDTCPYCGSNVHYTGNPMHLPVGTTLNGVHPYVLGACRGQGGFGVTYIALDAMTNARVAVKEYFPTYCSGRTSGMTIQSYYGQEDSYEKGRDRFLDEARMLQSLSDLNSVVNVADFFETNNTAYLVMEFLDGCSLKDYVLQNGKMPAKQFLEQLKNLMADIEAMHQRGVIHRDIAPDNIMLLQDGTLKLIDFGAARSYLGEKSMSVVVKKGFAPVEQHLRTGLTGATDVYALAASIYFCITGIVPPDSAERLYGNGDMQSPISLGADITPAQEAALAHALEVQPKNRTQSVAQFMGELFGQIPLEEPVVTDEKTEEEKDPFAFITDSDSEKKSDKQEEKKEDREKTSNPKSGPSREEKNKAVVGIVLVAAVVVCLIMLFTIPKMTAYNKASEQLENGYYLEAGESFKELGDYKDSYSKYLRAQYLYGKQLMGEGDYFTAAPVFRALGNYSDSEMLKQESFYQYALQLMEANKFDEAIHYFDSLGDYFNSAEMILECKYRGAFQSLEEGDNDTVIAVIQELTKHKIMADKINELKYQFVVANEDKAHNAQRIGINGSLQPSDIALLIHEYVSELSNSEYKDSTELYQEYYGWKATVTDFSYEEARKALAKYTTGYGLGSYPKRVLDDISRTKVDDFRFEFKITGGLPGEIVDLYAEYNWPNGKSGVWELEWNDKSHNTIVAAGWSTEVNFVCAGKFTVRICIRGTGECIGEHTMIVK